MNKNRCRHCLKPRCVCPPKEDVDLLDALKDSVAKQKSVRDLMLGKAKSKAQKFAKKNALPVSAMQQASRVTGRPLSKAEKQILLAKSYQEANEAARTSFAEFPSIATDKDPNELITVSLPRGVWMFMHRALLVYQSAQIRTNPGVKLLMKHLMRMIQI